MSSISNVSDKAPRDSQNSSAYGVQFEKHRQRLGQVVRARMHPRLLRRLDSDDVVQEIFLAAQQRLEQWKKGVSVPFFVWLRLITIQTVQNFHRFHLQARRRTLLQERYEGGGLSSSVPLAHVPGRTASTPSQVAMRREEISALEEALQKLSDNDREIISLRNFENLSNTEVAACLGISEKAASIRYVRALDRLRIQMNRDLEDPKDR